MVKNNNYYNLLADIANSYLGDDKEIIVSAKRYLVANAKGSTYDFIVVDWDKQLKVQVYVDDELKEELDLEVTFGQAKLVGYKPGIKQQTEVAKNL